MTYSRTRPVDTLRVFQLQTLCLKRVCIDRTVFHNTTTQTLLTPSQLHLCIDCAQSSTIRNGRPQPPPRPSQTNPPNHHHEPSRAPPKPRPVTLGRTLHDHPPPHARSLHVQPPLPDPRHFKSPRHRHHRRILRRENPPARQTREEPILGRLELHLLLLGDGEFHHHPCVQRALGLPVQHVWGNGVDCRARCSHCCIDLGVLQQGSFRSRVRCSGGHSGVRTPGTGADCEHGIARVPASRCGSAGFGGKGAADIHGVE